MRKRRIALFIISIFLVVTSLPTFAADSPETRSFVASSPSYSVNNSVTGLQVNQSSSATLAKQTVPAYANSKEAAITYSDIYYIDGAKRRPFTFQIDLPTNFANLTASITSKSLGHDSYWGYVCSASKSSSSTDNKTWYFYFDLKNAADLKTDISITDINVSVTNGTDSFTATLPTVTFKQLKEETRTPFINQNSIENEIRVGIPVNVERNNITKRYIKIVDSENKTVAESSTEDDTFARYEYYTYQNIFGTTEFSELGFDYIEFTALTTKKTEFNLGKYSIYLSFDYESTTSSGTKVLTYQKTIPDAITVTSDAVVSDITNYSDYPLPTYSNKEFFMVLKGYGIKGSKIGVKYVDDNNTVVAESVGEKCLSASQFGEKALTYKIQFKQGKSFVNGSRYYTVLVDNINNKEIRCGDAYIRRDPCFYSVTYNVTKPYAVFYFKGVNINTRKDFIFTLTDKDGNVLGSKKQTVYDNNEFTVDFSNNNTLKLYKNSPYYISCKTDSYTEYEYINTGNYGFDDPNLKLPVILKSNKYIYSNSKKLNISADFNKSFNVTTGGISIKFVKNDKGVSTVLATTSSAILTPYSTQYPDGSVDEGVNVSTELNWPSQTLYLSCTYKVIAVITNAGQSKEVEIGAITSISPYGNFIDIPIYYYDNPVFYFNNSSMYCEFDILKNNGITPDCNSLSFNLGNHIQLQNAKVKMVKESKDSVRYLLTADLPSNMYKNNYYLTITDLKTGESINPGNTSLKASYVSASSIKNILKTQISSSGEKAVYGFSVNEHEIAPDSLTMRLYNVCNINNRRDITNLSYQAITVNRDISEGNNSYCLKKDDLNSIDLTKRYSVVIVYDGQEIGVCDETFLIAKPTIKVEYVSINPNNSKQIRLGATMDINIWPFNATDKKLTCTSLNPEVAYFNENGQLVAKAKGTTDITISSEDGGFTGTYQIAVYESGDYDNNGKVDKADAISVLDSLDKGLIMTFEQLQFADMNNDNEITAADVTLILKKALGK